MLLQLSSKHLSSTVFLLLALFVFVGCGPTPEPVGSVTGSVKADDQTIGNCKVSIYNLKTRRKRATSVSDSGEYTLKNIPFGDYQVRVYPTPNDSPVEIPDRRIPKKYRRGETSGLAVSVSSEEEVVYDIELE